MFKFIKEASQELDHVVWPTPTENKKYMMYTIGVIVSIGIFLAVLGYIISKSLVFTRGQFSDYHTALPVASGEDTVNKEELDNILKNIKANTVSGEKTHTGKTSTGNSLSGNTTPTVRK